MRLSIFVGIAVVVSAPYFSPRTASAEESFTLSLYLASVQDVCPGGYQTPPKCPLFTSADFENLLRRGRVRPIETFPEVVTDKLDHGSIEHIWN